MKKHLLILIIAIILIIGYFAIFGSSKVEYAELRNEPHLKGNPEASVVLVEFSDFQCLDCGTAAAVARELVKEHQDNIKFEYRHFPLTSIAFKASEASECAADQGKFWEYHDILFLNQDSLTKSDLTGYASQIQGLDVELWQDCMDSGVKSQRVDEDSREAGRLGYNSTPTFILNGQKVSNWQNLPEMVQALLQPLVPLQQEATSTQSYLREVRLSS